MRISNTLIDISADRTTCSNGGALLLATLLTDLVSPATPDEHLPGLASAGHRHLPYRQCDVILGRGADCRGDLPRQAEPAKASGRHGPGHSDSIATKITRTMRTLRIRAWSGLSVWHPVKPSIR